MLRPLLPVPLPVELLPVLPELPLVVSLPLLPLVPVVPPVPPVPVLPELPLMLPVDPLPLVPDDVSVLLPVPLLEPLPEVLPEPPLDPLPLLEPPVDEPLVSVLEGEELVPEPDEAEPVPPEEPDELDALSLGSTTVVVVVTVFALESLDGAAELLDAASLGLLVVVVVVPCPIAAPAVPMRDRRIARGNFRIQAPIGLNVEGVFCECANLLDAFFVTGSHLSRQQQDVIRLKGSGAVTSCRLLARKCQAQGCGWNLLAFAFSTSCTFNMKRRSADCGEP